MWGGEQEVEKGAGSSEGRLEVGGGGVVFFFKQKTAYEMCGRDWSSDVCSSDLCVVEEILLTERQYVQDLEDIVLVR